MSTSGVTPQVCDEKETLMGLDVYLYRCANRAEEKRREDEFEKASEKRWSREGEYNSLTETQRLTIQNDNKALAATLELGEDGGSLKAEKVERDSLLYPKHMFKVGYFRSSYNEGGINSALRRYGLPDLYHVFAPGLKYEFAPDWDVALSRVNEVIAAYSAHLASDLGDLDVVKVDSGFLSPSELPPSANDALDRFKAARANESSFERYSNRDGLFDKEGMVVFAAIPGTHSLLHAEQPCVYLIVRRKREEGGDWYLQALEIVRETIEYVMAQPDKADYYFHWSS